MTVRLQISQSFWQDAVDYHFRFGHAWDETSHAKHRRIRTCIDLRFAYECILKSIVAYKMDDATGYVDALSEVVNCGHRLGRLYDRATPLPEGLDCDLPDCTEDFELLHANLRYSVESEVLTTWGEDLYSQTMRSDTWVSSAAQEIGCLIDCMGKLLGTHAQIVHVSEIPFPDNETYAVTRDQLKSIVKWWGVDR